MSNSEPKYEAEVNVISRSGPIRIELFDHQFKRRALGFGELRQRVPEGLYTLRYTAGTAQREERISVDPAETLSTIWVDLPFPSSAPISGSSTTHEFHHYPAIDLSRQPNKQIGAGGGLMIFARTIDGDGRVPVSLEPLSLWDSRKKKLLELNDQPAQNPGEGWAGQCLLLDPGGYALQWKPSERDANGSQGEKAPPIYQSLWVAKDWMTIVFLGYNSARGSLERQSASIHMVRPDLGFNDYEPQINQALELALGGLRTGNLIVPDDLLNLLLYGKFQNPMLGIIGAHALLQRRQKNWGMFDVVIGNLENLIPNDPDVIAVKLLGRHLRNDLSLTGFQPLNWPPMLYSGYKALIAHDWIEDDIIADGSPAEQAAANLLPESPWTCWLAVEAGFVPGVEPGAIETERSKAMLRTTDRVRGTHPALRGIIGKPLSLDPSEFLDLPDLSDPAVQRVSRYIADMKEMGETVELENMSLQDFRQLGLPVASVKKALQSLLDADYSLDEMNGEVSGPKLV